MGKLMLPPGFRFHPTDEELVSHYLKRKVCGRKIDFEAIGVVDFYKFEPWDLPEKSLLQTRDLEWYFFIPRDKKYANGSRANRATEKGYWKATGKDRTISSGARAVGMKKTLVYYSGRAPKGERTNWVMHEYRLDDQECQRLHALQNGYVLCRIYQKSGPGPKNGEQYGAPVEDDDLDAVPGQEDEHISPCSDILEPENNSATPVKDIIDGGSLYIKPETDTGFITPRSIQFSRNISPEDKQMVQELCDLLSQDESVTDGAEMFPRFASNGDFIELDDLGTAYGENVLQNNQENFDLRQSDILHDKMGTASSNPVFHPMNGDFIELNDLDGSVPDHYEDASQTLFSEASSLLTNGQQHQQIEIYSGGVQTEDNIFLRQNIGQGQFVDTSIFDELGGNNILESLIESSEPATLIQSQTNAEPEYSEVLEFFEQLEQLQDQGADSLNYEMPSGNVGGGMMHVSNNNVVSTDLHYYDTQCVLNNHPHENNSYPERNSMTVTYEANQYATVKTWNSTAFLGQDPPPSIQDESGILELLEDLPDLTNESSSPQGSVVTTAAEARKPGLDPYQYFLSCLESLPAFPASAAELSPKAANAAIAMSELNGKFVRSLSINSRKTMSKASSSGGFIALAIFIAVFAIFWMLIAGGAWKVFGGIYKFIMS